MTQSSSAAKYEKLTGCGVVINVGGASEVEVNKTKDLIDDATQHALQLVVLHSSTYHKFSMMLRRTHLLKSAQARNRHR